MDAKKRIAFHTLGCKLNFSETSTISRQFGMDDFEIVDFKEKAEYYVVHTCSVTAVADKKCRTAIRQAHRRNPLASIAVLGCAVQAAAESYAALPGVEFVLGTAEKFQLGAMIAQKEASQAPYHPYAGVADIRQTRQFIPSWSAADRTRSFFKVQDGCSYACTYCSIPSMRGRSRSASVAETIRVAHEIAAQGVKEIVLTGVNIGDFGRSSDENFFDLLRALKEVPGIGRIRISSVEPELLSNEIIQLVAGSPKLMPHFHIPLQSGSNKILRLMKRKYARELFAQRAETIRQLIPDACIVADVIVGFPGETGEDFEEACGFIQSLPLSGLHVFTYSERPGTPATDMPDKVNEATRKMRSKKLHEISAGQKRAFYQAHAGSTQQVLWESDEEEGFMHGFTENYIRLRTAYTPAKANTIETVIVGRAVTEDVCDCLIVGPSEK